MSKIFEAGAVKPIERELEPEPGILEEFGAGAGKRNLLKRLPGAGSWKPGLLRGSNCQLPEYGEKGTGSPTLIIRLGSFWIVVVVVVV